MTLTRRIKIIISLGVIIGAVVVITPSVIVPIANHKISFNLLYNAGVMIENRNIRIYIDPIDLPESYYDLPADIILITHPDGDHYQNESIQLIQRSNTLIVFPKNMTEEIIYFEATGVNPKDQIIYEGITITAFYMYTLPPEGLDYPASHPIEANWTSYIIDIGGFTIFHAGDSKNIDEYQELTGKIDLALLPLGPECQTMAEWEVVSALDVIQPKYFTPIHFYLLADDTFIRSYSEYVTVSKIVHLAYWESIKYNILTKNICNIE